MPPGIFKGVCGYKTRSARETHVKIQPKESISMAYIFKKPIKASRTETAKNAFEAKATFKDKDHLGAGEVHFQLSGNGANFDGKALANRLSQRRTWPLHRFFGYAALTYHRFGGTEAEKCLLLDNQTFIQLFDQPKTFLRELRRQGTELCGEWNTNYGGGKKIGERKHLDKSFNIEEVTVPFAGKDYRSEMRLVISTWNATRELQMAHNAKMTLEKLKVSIKHATSLPPRSARGEWAEDEVRLSSYGLYLPFHAFEKMCLSKEIGSLIRVAKQHLDQQPRKKQEATKHEEKEEEEVVADVGHAEDEFEALSPEKRQRLGP